jgi:hypothetical protein
MPNKRQETPMKVIKHPLFEGNTTVRCTEKEWFAMLEKKSDENEFQNNPEAAAFQLYQIAIGDTSGGRAASGLLLSLWNYNYAVNMRDVFSSLDTSNTAAALTLLKILGPGHHLEGYLTQDQIKKIISVWGETHAVRRL